MTKIERFIYRLYTGRCSDSMKTISRKDFILKGVAALAAPLVIDRAGRLFHGFVPEPSKAASAAAVVSPPAEIFERSTGILEGYIYNLLMAYKLRIEDFLNKKVDMYVDATTDSLAEVLKNPNYQDVIITGHGSRSTWYAGDAVLYDNELSQKPKGLDVRKDMRDKVQKMASGRRDSPPVTEDLIYLMEINGRKAVSVAEDPKFRVPCANKDELGEFADFCDPGRILISKSAFGYRYATAGAFPHKEGYVIRHTCGTDEISYALVYGNPKVIIDGYNALLDEGGLVTVSQWHFSLLQPKNKRSKRLEELLAELNQAVSKENDPVQAEYAAKSREKHIKFSQKMAEIMRKDVREREYEEALKIREQEAEETRKLNETYKTTLVKIPSLPWTAYFALHPDKLRGVGYTISPLEFFASPELSKDVQRAVHRA